METELELLDAARRMDQDTLVRIFDLYASPLYKYALRLCGDPVKADHLVGDVFTTLLEQFSAGNGPRANLRSYLYQTMYHRIIDEARSARHSAPLEAAEFLAGYAHSSSLSLEDQVIFKQIIHTVRNELTDDQRHVILLRFLEEFSLQETAAILGKELNHIKVIQNRALAKLRKCLDARSMDSFVPTPEMKPAYNVPGM